MEQHLLTSKQVLYVGDQRFVSYVSWAGELSYYNVDEITSITTNIKDKSRGQLHANGDAGCTVKTKESIIEAELRSLGWSPDLPIPSRKPKDKIKKVVLTSYTTGKSIEVDIEPISMVIGLRPAQRYTRICMADTGEFIDVKETATEVIQLMSETAQVPDPGQQFKDQRFVNYISWAGELSYYNVDEITSVTTNTQDGSGHGQLHANRNAVCSVLAKESVIDLHLRSLGWSPDLPVPPRKPKDQVRKITLVSYPSGEPIEIYAEPISMIIGLRPTRRYTRICMADTGEFIDVQDTAAAVFSKVAPAA